LSDSLCSTSHQSNTNKPVCLSLQTDFVKAFLSSAGIQNISKYAKFLAEWGILNEEDLSLITEDEHTKFAKQYKETVPDFNLPRRDLVRISKEAAKRTGNLVLK
jgi:hypothetical protein